MGRWLVTGQVVVSLSSPNQTNLDGILYTWSPYRSDSPYRAVEKDM